VGGACLQPHRAQCLKLLASAMARPKKNEQKIKIKFKNSNAKNFNVCYSSKLGGK
jgi:hypothetical protein